MSEETTDSDDPKEMGSNIDIEEPQATDGDTQDGFLKDMFKKKHKPVPYWIQDVPIQKDFLIAYCVPPGNITTFTKLFSGLFIYVIIIITLNS